MKYALIILISGFLFTGCQKELSYEPDKPPKSVRKYQLKAFYSDIPVDFIEDDDIVKSETDLWAYVSDYLKDDIDVFTENDTEVLIHQNDIKMPGNDEPILYKKYYIGTDSEGMFMNFLGPTYEPFSYRLQEINEDYFIIFLRWNQGASLFSRFERVRD
jgi:hypothetical protein